MPYIRTKSIDSPAYVVIRACIMVLSNQIILTKPKWLFRRYFDYPGMVFKAQTRPYS